MEVEFIKILGAQRILVGCDGEETPMSPIACIS